MSIDENKWFFSDSSISFPVPFWQDSLSQSALYIAYLKLEYLQR